MAQEICPRCGAAKHRGRCKGGAVSNRKTQETPAPVKLSGHLEVPSGLGFRAAIEDTLLVLEQDRADDEGTFTHTVSLAPHEARQLVDWIAERVGYP